MYAHMYVCVLSYCMYIHMCIQYVLISVLNSKNFQRRKRLQFLWILHDPLTYIPYDWIMDESNIWYLLWQGFKLVIWSTVAAVESNTCSITGSLNSLFCQ